MNRKIIRKITLTAMLIVIDILLTAIPRYFEIGAMFSFNRITLGPATTIFSSLVLGPLYGGIVGGASDFLAWIIFPNSGSVINIFITILYILLGILPYYLFKLIKKVCKSKEFFEICLIVICLLTFLYLLIFTTSFDESFVNWGWDLSIAKIVISIIGTISFVGTGVILHLINKDTHNSAIDIAIICIVCEIVLMVLLKPLCFLTYAELFFGESIQEKFGVTYSLLALLGVLFSSVMIPLNTFFVTYVRNLFYKVVKDKELYE